MPTVSLSVTTDTTHTQEQKGEGDTPPQKQVTVVPVEPDTEPPFTPPPDDIPF